MEDRITGGVFDNKSKVVGMLVQSIKRTKAAPALRKVHQNPLAL